MEENNTIHHSFMLHKHLRVHVRILVNRHIYICIRCMYMYIYVNMSHLHASPQLRHPRRLRANLAAPAASGTSAALAQAKEAGKEPGAVVQCVW